jgi:type I restriction enzyme S subunit
MTTRLLGDVCDVTMGQAPVGESYNIKHEGIPLIAGASDLGEVTPSVSRWTTAPSQTCQRGDIVLCVRATIGDRNWADRDYCLGRGVAGLRARPGRLDSRFLWHWLETATPELLRRGRGATFLQVTRKDVESLAVPVPPMSEQRRVADLLDKADAIRRKRKHAIALTDDLLRSTFLDMFGDPVSNPKGWPLSPLGEALIEIESGWSPVCLPRPAEESEWGVLKLGSVTFGRYDENENKAFSPDEEPVRELEVKAGDVLFARKNTYEHVAACVLIERTRPRLVLPDLIFRLVSDPAIGLEPAVLWGVMSQPTKRKQVQALAGGTSGSMPNISKERLRTVLVPVPPRPLQARFSDMVAHHSQIRSRLAESAALNDELQRGLVNRAFSIV